jgi:hypothetical protein
MHVFYTFEKNTSKNLDFNHGRRKSATKSVNEKGPKVTPIFDPFLSPKMHQNTFKTAASGAILTFLENPKWQTRVLRSKVTFLWQNHGQVPQSRHFNVYSTLTITC